MAFETQAHLHTKRARADSDPVPETDDMDFHHTENITPTQAIGDEADAPGCAPYQLSPPVSPEHAAMRADFEIITMAALEQLYDRITSDIEKSASDTTNTLRKANDQLRNQVTSLGASVTQLQQQLLSYQKPVPPPTKTPMAAPAKKVLKLKLAKNSAQAVAATASAADTSPPAASTTSQIPPPNTRGCETVLPRAKVQTPKLILTKYPQAEREVTCYFQSCGADATDGTQPEKSYSERQAIADGALCRVNSVLVDNKDVLASPFIRARVTIRGSIIFTTSNDQNNVVYEHYTAIIAEALANYGVCEKVEIGRRFSQFLLHGVPTHLSMSEISDSIATNYPQLVQGQTPRWLTTAERHKGKANSTIVITLTGNIKKASIGRQNLIVCNRECQLDDYIPYGRSTQYHNCQTYGHPTTLCRNETCCAVGTGPHNTREHPCTLPTCRKGPACTHPLIRCINCNAPHKANDPNCPECLKLRNYSRIATMGDAPMAGAAN